MTQIRFQFQPLDRLAFRFGGEKAKIVFSLFLGAVHRHVGVLGQGLYVVAVVRVYGDTDTACGAALVSGKNDGWQKGRQYLFRNDGNLFPTGNPVEKDDELVAAKPRDKGAVAHATFQPVGHLDQQRVAGLVPKRVVDDLEAVEIDE